MGPCPHLLTLCFRVFWQIAIFPIGLRGEEAVSFLSKKRFRPVFKGKNIFFKFFLFMNWAKLNKKFVKKIYFRKKKIRKKIINLPVFGSKTPIFWHFFDFFGYFQKFRSIFIKLWTDWLEETVEYRVFTIKSRKSRIVIFTEMRPLPHLLTLWDYTLFLTSFFKHN